MEEYIAGQRIRYPYETWMDVVMLANIKIALQDYTANVRTKLEPRIT